MKKIVLALSLALASGSPLIAATPSTLGIPWDKALHFSAGYISSDVTQTFFLKHGAGPWTSRLAGLTVATLLASTPGNRWDWQDWGATALGSVCSITVHF